MNTYEKHFTFTQKTALKTITSNHMACMVEPGASCHTESQGLCISLVFFGSESDHMLSDMFEILKSLYILNKFVINSIIN